MVPVQLNFDDEDLFDGADASQEADQDRFLDVIPNVHQQGPLVSSTERDSSQIERESPATMTQVLGGRHRKKSKNPRIYDDHEVPEYKFDPDDFYCRKFRQGTLDNAF